MVPSDMRWPDSRVRLPRAQDLRRGAGRRQRSHGEALVKPLQHPRALNMLSLSSARPYLNSHVLGTGLGGLIHQEPLRALARALQT